VLVIACKLVAGDRRLCLEPPYESLEVLWSKLFSEGSFSNTPFKCSVKCPRGDKLFSESFWVVGLSHDHTSTIPCVDPSLLSKADSSSIANQSWAC
jgi:hypothetical protein